MTPAFDYVARLEQATRGLLELDVAVLGRLNRRVGLAPLRALQCLDHLGPCRVTQLSDAMGLVPSTASRLSDRLADAGLITRRVSPTNRRATILELTDAGRAILGELVVLRRDALTKIAGSMSDEDRAAFLQGASAFSDARLRIAPPPAARRPRG